MEGQTQTRFEPPRSEEPRFDPQRSEEPRFEPPRSEEPRFDPPKRKFNGWDVLLWLICWPWALMRLIGRHRRWSPAKGNWTGIAATVGLLFVVVAITAATAPVEPQGTASPTVTQEAAPTDTEPEPATTTPVEPTPVEPAQPTLTSGQENALESAKQYLDMSGFSKAGLIEQLSSEAGDGYSRADATYAATHAGADWKAEAVESAKQYLDMGGFSRSSLIEQLSSDAGDGYTMAQARYAVSQVY